MAEFELTKDNTKEVKKCLEQQALQALTMCGLVAEGYAKLNLTDSGAVDTGLLRNSCTWSLSGKSPDVTSYKADRPNKQGEYKSGSYSGTEGSTDEKAVYIGTNVKYAPYIEYGTGKHVTGGRKTVWTWTDRNGKKTSTHGMSARPFIRPAIADHIDEYKKIITKVLKGQ